MDSTRAQMLGVYTSPLILASRRLPSTVEHAYGMEQASFRELLEETRTRTYSNSVLWLQNMPTLLIDNVQDVPEAVKQQILSSIRSFLDKQIE